MSNAQNRHLSLNIVTVFNSDAKSLEYFTYNFTRLEE